MRQLKIFGAVLAATLSIVGCGQLPSQSPSTGVQSYGYDYGYGYSSHGDIDQTNVIGAATQVSGNNSVLVQKNAAGGSRSDADQTNVIGAATQVSGYNSILIQRNSAGRRGYHNTY